MALKRMTSGNIFKIIDENEVRYFQYFYTDPYYLGGDLIWVFNQNKFTNDLNEIINSGYNFCFYTTVDAGVKLKKWQLIGNAEISIEMRFKPEFLWRDIETGDWFIMKYNSKINIGKNLNENQSKIQVVSFQFPVGAVESIISSKEIFLKQITDFYNIYCEKNRSY